MSKLQNNAHKWMMEGIKEHEAFNRDFKLAREHAINAGFFFLSARQHFEHGEWGEFLFGYTHKLSSRQIYFYSQLAKEAIEWVKHAQPKLIGIEKIQVAARALVMESPKPLIALCRELGHMRKFGEYDSVKYKAGKMRGDDSQIEFAFSAVTDTLDLLCSDAHIKYPEGRDEVEALTELKGKLEAALKKVSTIIKHGRVIET